MFVVPAGSKYVRLFCHVWGPLPKSDWDLVFGNVVFQLLEPGTNSWFLHFPAVFFSPVIYRHFQRNGRCAVLYGQPFSAEYLFLAKSFHSPSKLPPSFVSGHQLLSGFSVWLFFLLLSLTPTFGAEIFIQLFGWPQEGLGICYEAANGFPVAGCRSWAISGIT